MGAGRRGPGELGEASIQSRLPTGGSEAAGGAFRQVWRRRPPFSCAWSRPPTTCPQPAGELGLTPGLNLAFPSSAGVEGHRLLSPSPQLCPPTRRSALLPCTAGSPPAAWG